MTHPSKWTQLEYAAAIKRLAHLNKHRRLKEARSLAGSIAIAIHSELSREVTPRLAKIRKAA